MLLKNVNIVSHWPRWVLCGLLSQMLLSGCVSYRPDVKDTGTVEARNTDQLLLEAAKAASPIKENLQLQAAEILLQQDVNRGLSLLFDIDAKYLSDQNFVSYTLLYGRWAIDKAQTDLARNLLTNDRIERLLTELDADRAINLYEIRAEFFTRDRQAIRAITEYISMTPLLITDAEQEKNNTVIWSLLQQLTPEEVQQLLSQNVSDRQIKGWVELTPIVTKQELDIDAQVAWLNTWLDRYPHHPAALHLPRELQLLQTAIKQKPQRITLLLPLSGTLQKAGEAVRDGFMAAYYQAMHRYAQSSQNTLPQIRIIDSQQNEDFLATYNDAAGNDTDLIIGPLEKEKIVLLQGEGRLPVPTLVLNDIENRDMEKTTNLYFFGLNPEDEARQAASEARFNHHERALVIAPASEWGTRVSTAFVAEWQSQGGTALGSVLFDVSKDDYSTVLQQALGISDSKTRKQWLRQWTADSLEFEPRRRQDVDMIFLAARPEQAHQIKPLLDFHYAGDIPVYATSSVFSGQVDPEKNADLNGIQLMASPWLLETSELKSTIDKFLPTSSSFQSLSAMGADAWRLHERLILLSSNENSRLHGYTGILRMNSQQRIYRQQLWVVMDQGKINLVPSLVH
jgi:outer membrane PBP1 activator LpoA protein